MAGESTTVLCPHCGSEIQYSHRYCPHCRAKLQDDAPTIHGQEKSKNKARAVEEAKTKGKAGLIGTSVLATLVWILIIVLGFVKGVTAGGVAAVVYVSVLLTVPSFFKTLIGSLIGLGALLAIVLVFYLINISNYSNYLNYVTNAQKTIDSDVSVLNGITQKEAKNNDITEVDLFNAKMSELINTTQGVVNATPIIWYPKAKAYYAGALNYFEGANNQIQSIDASTPTVNVKWDLAGGEILLGWGDSQNGLQALQDSKP